MKKINACLINIYKYMKIQRFYEFSEFPDDFYYYLVTYGQYQRLFNNLKKFHEYEYFKLKKLISDNYIIEYRIYYTHLFPDDNKGFTNVAPQIMIHGKGKSFTISKLKDEYFLIEVNDTDQLIYSNRKGNYFYCDQLDGVIKFLSDEGVIKSNSVNENKQENEILYIFDFDDTLVLNPSFEALAIEYLKEDVNIKSLLTSSVKKIGVKLSDLRWENKRIYVPDPEQKIEVNGNWVRKGKRVYLTTPDRFYFTDLSLPIDTTDLEGFYNSVKNKAIVTGRSNDIRDKVLDSLKKFKLDIPNYGLYCYPTTRQTEDRVSTWKAKTIVKLIKETGFTQVHFYDDNTKWVRQVTEHVKKELPNIKFKGIKYKHQHG